MPDIASLVVRIQGDEKGGINALGAVDKKVKEAGGSSGWKSILTNALSFAGGVGALSVVSGALSLVKDHLGELFTAGEDANRMDALLAAGLRSTKDASGQTMQSFQSLADTIRIHTGITDDAVKAGEQMLETFTGIGPKVFGPATQAVADMATRMNSGAIPSTQQMSQMALQLGKALNDPATGMTRLQRLGVTFTKSQIDQAKAMEAAGNKAGAQAIILGELNKEFGGSAAAAGQANGGMAIFAATVDDLKEKVGQQLVPILSGLTQNVIAPLATLLSDKVSGALGVVTGFMQRMQPVLSALGDGARTLGGLFLSGIKPGLDAIGEAFSHLQGPGLNVSGLVQQITAHVKDAAPVVRELGQHFGDLLAKIAPLLPHLGEIAGHLLPLLSPALAFVTDHAKTLGDVFGTLRGVLAGLMPHLQSLWGVMQQNIIPALQVVIPFVLNLAHFIGEVLLKALQFLLPIIGFLAGLLLDALGGAITVVGAIIRAVVPVVQKLGEWLGVHLTPIVHNVSEELGKLHAWFNDKVLPVLNKVWGFIQANVLPILQKLGAFILNVLVTNLHTMWDVFSNDILPILGKVAGFVAGAIGTAFDGFGKGIQNVTGFIGNLFAAIGNLLGQLGKLKDTIGNVLSHIPSIPGLPHFAAGGVMGASGLAVVGEQGPEMVALPAGARIYSAAQTQAIAARGQASASASGALHSTFIIQLDSRTIAQSTLQHLPGLVRIGTGIRHI